MNVSDLVASLNSEGLVLAVSGRDLRVLARPGVVSADKLDQVRQHKLAIVAYLNDQDSATTYEASGDDSRTSPKTASKVPICPNSDTVNWDLPPTTKRLNGCGFPSRATKQPPACILADPVVVCPRCNQSRVLPELTTMTGGLCWGCHL
ncbi:MAG: hypothetical protein H8E66_33990 [Planctomycetes bacterium]|nr:hypothetical protein [Planctomycetota bacterium]